ncbi:MAG: hypothetical protein JW862_02850 [Anaerolineales bacterium]|nr:hypothetical protein [Anaerolineales bacterium]
MKRTYRRRNVFFVFLLVLLGAVTLFFGARYLFDQLSAVKPESEEYIAYRDRALRITPSDVGVPDQFDPQMPFGVIFDFYLDNDLTTATAYANGDASIFFENGGGVLGGSTYEIVRNAALEVIIAGADVYPLAEPATGTPYPQPGQVGVYLMALDGVRFIDGQASDLTSGTEPLAELYQAVQNLTEQLRKISEDKE